MSVPSWLRDLRDRSETLLTLNYGLSQLIFRLGIRPHLSGSTHQKYTIEQGTEYVQRVFQDYLTMMGESPQCLRGKQVLEVGPGDNYGVALLFTAHGARVHCLDRFAPLRDAEKNRGVYLRLAEAADPSIAPGLRDLLTPSGEIRQGAITVHDGLAIEQAGDVLEPGSFDLIVSRAVLEHVQDLERSWAIMDRLLAPAGRSVHKVDFRHHGFYGSIHPLAFLKRSAWLWDLISAPDPTLNRQRTGTYQRLCRDFGYASRTFVTHWSLSETELALGAVLWPPADSQIFGREEVASYRVGLDRRFRELEVADLSVAGIFIAARRDERKAGA